MENLPLGQFFVILDLVLTNIFCYSYSQLVIKAVVDSSLRLGRQVDMENLPLRQFFVILDLVFRHGFKSGTGSIIPLSIVDPDPICGGSERSAKIYIEHVVADTVYEIHEYSNKSVR